MIRSCYLAEYDAILPEDLRQGDAYCLYAQRVSLTAKVAMAVLAIITLSAVALSIYTYSLLLSPALFLLAIGTSLIFYDATVTNGLAENSIQLFQRVFQSVEETASDIGLTRFEYYELISSFERVDQLVDAYNNNDFPPNLRQITSKLTDDSAKIAALPDKVALFNEEFPSPDTESLLSTENFLSNTFYLKIFFDGS